MRHLSLILKRILALRGGRDLTLTSMALSFVGKALGYVRVLLMAHFFGAGAALDAYYIASGVVTLFVTPGTNAFNASALPELEHCTNSQKSADLVAALWWITLASCVLIAAILAFASSTIIKLLAPGFEPERLALGKAMVLWLIPYTFAILMRKPYEVWALRQSHYTLPFLWDATFNFFAIPALLLLVSYLGPFSVPATMSLGYVSLLIVASLTTPFPYLPKSWPWRELVNVGWGFILCLGLVGAGALYEVTDRFFASMLPIGSVASLSYALTLFHIPGAIFAPSLLLYLAKACRSAAIDPQMAERELKLTLALVYAYLLPLGIGMAAVGAPLVNILLGHGAFEESAVQTTTACLQAYVIVLPFSVSCQVFARYAQATQSLRIVVTLSYITVGVNALLDWILAPILGAPGIALATSGVWAIQAIVYKRILLPEHVNYRKMAHFFLYVLFALAWAVPLYFLSKQLEWLPLLTMPLCLIGQLFLSEKAGWLEAIHPAWRPTGLLRYMAGVLGLKAKR